VLGAAPTPTVITLG